MPCTSTRRIHDAGMGTLVYTSPPIHPSSRPRNHLPLPVSRDLAACSVPPNPNGRCVRLLGISARVRLAFQHVLRSPAISTHGPRPVLPLHIRRNGNGYGYRWFGRGGDGGTEMQTKPVQRRVLATRCSHVGCSRTHVACAPGDGWDPRTWPWNPKASWKKQGHPRCRSNPVLGRQILEGVGLWRSSAE